MKIAYIYDAVYPYVKGGAEKRLFEISRRLVRRGHEVHCLGLKWWPGEDHILQEGVHLHGICRPMDLYSGGRRSIREAFLFSISVFRSLKGEYDLVDCQEFPYLPCFSARWRCQLSSIPMVITWLEVWGAYWDRYLGLAGCLGRLTERASVHLTRNHIAISPRTQRDLESLGVTSHLIPSGLDLARIYELKAAPDSWDLIYAGRLSSHKNLDLLLQALALLREYDPPLRCLILGEGPEDSRLRNKARELGLGDQVEFRRFTEREDEVFELIKASRLFVLPSTREGFGMAALEALGCGVPVVTLNHPQNAAADLILPGKTGYLSNPDPSSLAQALEKGLAKGRTMRTACLDTARRYDWQGITLQLEKVYEEILHG